MKIAVIDAFPDEFITELKSISDDVLDVRGIAAAQLPKAISGTEILVMNSKIKIDSAVLDALPELKMVCRAGVGLDHIDVALCEQRGVEVVSTPGANRHSVGEQTVGMLLALLHKVVAANNEVKKGKWLREKNRGRELGSMTVGIIGFGNTGSAVAAKLRGFNCRILAFDKYETEFAPEYVEEVTLESIQREADILTLHIPLTEETREWANEELFQSFAKPFFFLNLSRGPILRTSDLILALESGKVVGAALDVLENEKLTQLDERQRGEFEKLSSRDDVILTPHVGGWSVESLQNINGKIIEAIRRLVSPSSSSQT